MQSTEFIFEEQILAEGITDNILNVAKAAAVAGLAMLSNPAEAASLDDFVKSYSKAYAVAHYCEPTVASAMKRNLYMFVSKLNGNDKVKYINMLTKDAKGSGEVSCDIKAHGEMKTLAKKFIDALKSGKLDTATSKPTPKTKYKQWKNPDKGMEA